MLFITHRSFSSHELYREKVVEGEGRRESLLLAIAISTLHVALAWNPSSVLVIIKFMRFNCRRGRLDSVEVEGIH